MGFFRSISKKQVNNNLSDAALVQASLAGDRDAFSRIVQRYQSLLCSLAYASVGDLKHSEDLAQETFIEAWRNMPKLREAEKLKSWLCGILRFKLSHFHRKEARQPFRHAEEMDDHSREQVEAPNGDALQTSLELHAIKEQQAQLLWQTLETLPENYRAPLVLFYREQCSVEVVAQTLDLSESTAKQRLSRGRKLLQQAMLTFVEETLRKSKPGSAFTLAVMLAIADIAPPAKAASLGAGALKAGTVFKWTTLFVFFTSFSGVIASFFSVRAAMDQSRTGVERRRTLRIVALYLVFAFVFVAAMFLLRYAALQFKSHGIAYFIASQGLVLAFVASYLFLLFRRSFKDGVFRAQQRELHPEAFLGPADAPDAKQRDYRSRFKLLGVPLVHFKLGMPEIGEQAAFAWIAGGQRAYGLLFAWGGFAVAPISVGIVSLGFFTCGNIALGVLAIGTVCCGVIGFGASAIGIKAYSSLSSLGWHSAISGGFSAAREAAIGPIAFAKQVNNEAAAASANLSALNNNYLWVLAVMAFFVIVPAVWHAKKVRQSMGTKKQ